MMTGPSEPAPPETAAAAAAAVPTAAAVPVTTAAPAAAPATAAAAAAPLPRWRQRVLGLPPAEAAAVCGGNEQGAVDRLVTGIIARGSAAEAYMCDTFEPDMARLIMAKYTISGSTDGVTTDDQAVAVCLLYAPDPHAHDPHARQSHPPGVSNNMGRSSRQGKPLYHCKLCGMWHRAGSGAEHEKLPRHKKKLLEMKKEEGRVEGREEQARRSTKVSDKNNKTRTDELGFPDRDKWRDPFDVQSHTTDCFVGCTCGAPGCPSLGGGGGSGGGGGRTVPGPGSDEVRVDERGRIHLRSEDGSGNPAETARACRHVSSSQGQLAETGAEIERAREQGQAAQSATASLIAGAGVDMSELNASSSELADMQAELDAMKERVRQKLVQHAALQERRERDVASHPDYAAFTRWQLRERPE
jgi:hypothetical protein